MKNVKKILALLVAVMMIVAMVPAMADVPTKGSITVNSPIVGATYKAYKIFDMKTNETVDAFSYTIDENSPFYGAVVAYAGTEGKGLTLSRIQGSDPAVYNVNADESAFNAQDFGKAMQAVLETGSPAVEADAEKGIVAKAAGSAAIAPVNSVVATVETSDQVKFENLDLGYFLINPTYPAASYGTVKIDDDTTFTVEDLAKDGDALKDPLELTDAAKAKINTYVENTVDDDYVDKYIEDNAISTNKDGTPLSAEGKAEYKADLIASMKKDAEEKVLNAFANKFDGSEADINVKEPILVFLDSSQPNAVINEKNELDKWDVPVNPDGETKPGTPDHGEPEGGKNIVVQEDPAYYADWSEAEIGESVHYQLRVNAVNFIRTGTTDDTVQQVKEYFLADYQSGHMTFDESKGLKVTVWAGSDGNDSQATDKANVTKDADGNTVTELDYTDKSSTFFKNTTNKDAESKPTDIFGEGTGIMVPWVKVVKGTDADPDSSFPIYTITNVPAVDGEGNPVYKTEEAKMEDGNKVPATDENGAVIDGQFVSVNGNIINADGQLIGEDNQPIQDTDAYYVYSLYNSDVTIVVDYWMILNDDAIVDEPGNKNYAQYAWSPVDNKDNSGKPKQPGTPKNDDKPSQKEEVDEATVYTFALAWVKVDDKANELAGAKFKLPFYVKATKDNDGAYVYGGTKAGEGLTNEVTTTAESAVITIKGVEQGTYSIEETEAPVGYNKLTAPFDVEAKKSGDGVTTKTKTTIYLDADGNVTDTTTETTVEKATDKDSNVDNVPVYQFDPIVNKQGNELPATGGIGTTIFTVGGSLLALAAAILLVTKRRMNNND